MILILRQDKLHFRANWLLFLGIWGEAELFLGIWGAKANTFRERRKSFAGKRGDQCIIFRDQGSTDSTWALELTILFIYNLGKPLPTFNFVATSVAGWNNRQA